MGILARCAVPTIILLLLPAFAGAAPPTKGEIRDALDAGTEKLIALQRADGSWKADANEAAGFDVGATVLAVRALVEARRHTSNNAWPKLVPAIDKGLAFVVSRWPEPKTYTAGTVLPLLRWCNPGKYSKHISMYGWMLVTGQLVAGPQAGGFGYDLVPFPKDFDATKNSIPPGNRVRGPCDNSNAQFAALALLAAEKSGIQIPKACWGRLQKYYLSAQHPDGGWDYQSDAFRAMGAGGAAPVPSNRNMTLASAVSLLIANEKVDGAAHAACRPQPSNDAVERGLDWLDRNFNKGAGLDAYGWWTCERLGLRSGRGEFGGVDWYDTGASQLVGPVTGGNVAGRGGNMPNLALAILFLSAGPDRTEFLKLKRAGDWNLHPHDVAHVAEYMTDGLCGGLIRGWRVVTLDASVDDLLRAPVLWIGGHDPLKFTDAEKQKLKSYVDRGGTIVAEDCCGRAEFDKSFRALVAELWPDRLLSPLPKDHEIYVHPFNNLGDYRPRILGTEAATDPDGRGVLYFPEGISCKWERAGGNDIPALSVGVNLTFYAFNRWYGRDKPAAEAE